MKIVINSTNEKGDMLVIHNFAVNQYQITQFEHDSKTKSNTNYYSKQDLIDLANKILELTKE